MSSEIPNVGREEQVQKHIEGPTSTDSVKAQKTGGFQHVCTLSFSGLAEARTVFKEEHHLPDGCRAEDMRSGYDLT